MAIILWSVVVWALLTIAMYKTHMALGSKVAMIVGFVITACWLLALVYLAKHL